MKHFIHCNGDLRVEGRCGVVTREQFRFHHQNISTTRELRATLRAGKYASPGSYPIFFATYDGDCLCWDCVKTDYRDASRDIRNGYSGRIVACEVNWDSALTCCGCNTPIESAYDIVEEGE